MRSAFVVLLLMLWVSLMTNLVLYIKYHQAQDDHIRTLEAHKKASEKKLETTIKEIKISCGPEDEP